MPKMEKNEHRLAANRERVRRYRAQVTPPRAEPKPAPLTGAERAQRHQQKISFLHPERQFVVGREVGCIEMHLVSSKGFHTHPVNL